MSEVGLEINPPEAYKVMNSFTIIFQGFTFYMFLPFLCKEKWRRFDAVYWSLSDAIRWRNLEIILTHDFGVYKTFYVVHPKQ